jgi:K+ transporter
MARPADAASLSALGLSALGVVFGDIGTSPLYTLKTVLGLTGGDPDSVVTLGVLSLVIWTLIVVTTIKYVSVAMRVDNDGEGGILALMSLLGVKRQHRPIIIAFGLFGAALIYGDGAITPAISVLSALEGLDIIFPAFAPYVLPFSVLILVALFAIQPQGTARLGRAFGPIMALWFAQQHGTVITQHYTEPDLRLVVRPSRLRPVMDAPRPWPSTRLRIAFLRLPQRYRYRRCPYLSYGPPRSRPEHRESIYEIRSSGRIQQNP